MKNIINLIPHIPSTDLKETSRFFVVLFGFTINKESEYYIELKNRNYTIGLVKAITNPNEQSLYFQVTEIEGMWHKIKGKIIPLKHRALFNQEYGMKEFHIIVPKTETLLMVGEEINA